jgi:hypothetical protein
LLEIGSTVESDAKRDNHNRTDQHHYFCPQTHKSPYAEKHFFRNPTFTKCFQFYFPEQINRHYISKWQVKILKTPYSLP